MRRTLTKSNCPVKQIHRRVRKILADLLSMRTLILAEQRLVLHAVPDRYRREISMEQIETVEAVGAFDMFFKVSQYM